MHIKRLINILLLAIIPPLSMAQQMPLFSQYLYNKFLINPAVAGSDGYTTIDLAVREQWVGISKAPHTYSLSVQKRFLKRGYILKNSSSGRQIYRPKTDAKIGLGGSVFSFTSGLLQRSGGQISYSYHMWLQKETQLSFGLSFTAYYFRINEREIIVEDPNDPILFSNLRRGIFVPDASSGVYLLNRKYNAGFSADQLFGALIKTDNPAYSNYAVRRTYYLFGSYGFGFDVDGEVRPTVLLRMSEQLKPQADLGLNISFDRSLWCGLTYRTNGDLIINPGMKYASLYIGYALDFSFNKIQRITYGTHEVNIAWKFGDSSRKYRWLDRY
jgi:type IX secretion system PorP/SprF family membrane protein